MKHLITCCLLAVLITSCSDEQIESKSINESTVQVGNTESQNSELPKGESSTDKLTGKRYNGVNYTVSLINAVEFVTRKGEKLELSERMELSKESVAILKIDLQNSKETSVFESSKMTMNKEDALKYLVGQISTDFNIEQDGQSISPLGVEYEAGISEPHNIKVFLFFNKINLNKPSSVIYYDRLFGAGLMRFKINNRK